jgi:glycosyltransferase involved in cell wall biosynthesis
MKRIAVLGDTLAGGKIYGIQRFAYELLRQLDRMDLSGLEIELVVPEYAPEAESLAGFKKIRVVRSGRIRNAFLWRQICFPLYAIRRRALTLDLTLGLPVLKCDIAGLYDCTYELFPEDFRTFREKMKRLSYLAKARLVSRRSKRLIVLSRTAGEQLKRCYRIPASKLRLVPCAWQHLKRIREDLSVLDEFELVRKDSGQVRPYYFTLGSVLPHKNLKWIAEAARQNPDSLFVVTGSLELSDYIGSTGLLELENVIVTGYLTDEKVKALMKHAAACIHPSLSEGFGIPPMEALSAGSRILLSDAGCLPEIYGGSAVYFDPRIYAPIRMEELMSREAGPAGDVLKKYSWRRSALRLKKVLEEIG